MNTAIDTSKDVKIEKADPEKVLVALTDSEVLQRSRRAAQLEQQVEKKKKDLADAQKLEKSEIAKLESVRKQISQEIAVGQRYIEVDCLEVYNFRLGKVSLIRVDTREEIRERPMTVLERQQELPLDDDSSGTDGADLEDPDDDTEDDEPEHNPDTEEHPDTSLLDDAASLARDQADSAAGRGTDGEPLLATQKKKRAPRGEGKGSRGGKAKS
jgi:hypothetical protein